MVTLIHLTFHTQFLLLNLKGKYYTFPFILTSLLKLGAGNKILKPSLNTPKTPSTHFRKSSVHTLERIFYAPQRPYIYTSSSPPIYITVTSNQVKKCSFILLKTDISMGPSYITQSHLHVTFTQLKELSLLTSDRSLYTIH